MNATPSVTVNHMAWIALGRLPSRIAWCAQVTVVPEVKRISVLRNGIWNGSKVSMPTGGQTPPVASAGNRLALKKAQKKPAKNITSEAMNNAMP